MECRVRGGVRGAKLKIRVWSAKSKVVYVVPPFHGFKMKVSWACVTFTPLVTTPESLEISQLLRYGHAVRQPVP